MQKIIVDLYDKRFYNRNDEVWKDDNDVMNAMKGEDTNEDWDGADADMDREVKPCNQNHDTVKEVAYENETYYDNEKNNNQPPKYSTITLDKNSLQDGQWALQAGLRGCCHRNTCTAQVFPDWGQIR